MRSLSERNSQSGMKISHDNKRPLWQTEESNVFVGAKEAQKKSFSLWEPGRACKLSDPVWL